MKRREADVHAVEIGGEKADDEESIQAARHFRDCLVRIDVVGVCGPAAATAGGLVAEAIPEDIKPEELLLSAANHAATGNVKICAPAMDKARTSPFRSALDFRAAEAADDPLRAAALLTIALALSHYRRLCARPVQVSLGGATGCRQRQRGRLKTLSRPTRSTK